MADSPATPFHLFGIRHHGPGCARSLIRALEELQPDCLLVEGPPDGEEMLTFMQADGLVPPVALLVYNPDDAREAAFYPFAAFSPEWNALRFALERQIPARFIDLPAAHRFALNRPAADEDDGQTPGVAVEAPARPEDEAGVENGPEVAVDTSEPSGDPLDWLGRAAGYDDGEAWWNHLVEERGDSLELFAAIGEAMSCMRNEAPPRTSPASVERREALREAHMRKCLRQAQKEGFQRIAVVCGAWHVPALSEIPPAKADNDLLKGLPKIKVASTWVPWSYHNLSFTSGYGAGVASAGWYEHLWQSTREDRAVGWLTRAARLFRESGLDCSSAHIIETVRLADALAALRDRPQPGLDELDEALRTVVCMGDEVPMQLIRRKMTVGDHLGHTPETTPAVPLQRDLQQQQKSLRLKAEATQKTIDLDLRQENDLARSHLLHRLRLLDIDWGSLSRTGRNAKGSFHELWTIQWAPDLVISVINASRWGNSVRQAAIARATDRARTAGSLPELSELVNQVLLADLNEAVAPVSQALENHAAITSDILQLMAAVPSLANIARYGNVRQTDAGMVEHLLDSLVPRAAIGLPGACSTLDDEAAQAMRTHIITLHQALGLLARHNLQEEWQQSLHRLSELGSCHGLICGLANRLLFDEQLTSLEQTSLRMSQALSVGNDPGPAAAWLEGFLNQSGMVLLHDPQLWAMVDGWLGSLGEDDFIRELPLLRRAFAAFSTPERRQLGERVNRSTVASPLTSPSDWDTARAEQVLPLLHQLLGIQA